MPAVIPDHVARRNRFRDTTQAAWELNEHLETVTAVKSQGSSEVFHGKVDFSQPPWNTQAANQVLDLHAWSRDTEALWRLRAGLPARTRGGSSANTRIALEALTRLSEAVDDATVQVADRQLNAWCKKARVVLGEAESARRLPRSQGEREACCPWCKRDTLRQMALAGVVFCVDPGCVDDEGRRPRAQLEYFDNDWVLRWQDNIIGSP